MNDKYYFLCYYYYYFKINKSINQVFQLDLSTQFNLAYCLQWQIMNNQLKQKSTSKKKLNKKCKSQQVIKLAHNLKTKQQELLSLKNKIQLSQNILFDIYSKVKRKQSMYELKIVKNQVKCNQLKSLAQQYKNCYHQGMHLLQKSLQQRNKKPHNPSAVDQFKNKVLQKIRANRINISTQQNNQLSKKSNNIPKFFEQRQIKNFTNQQTFINGKQSRKTNHLDSQQNSNIKQRRTKKQDERIKSNVEQTTLHNRSVSLYNQYRNKISVNKNQNVDKFAKNKSKKIIEQLQHQLNQLKIVRKKSQMRLQKNNKLLIAQKLTQKQKPQLVKKQSQSSLHNNSESSQDQQKLKNIQQKNKERFIQLKSEKLNKIM